jgi:hypothetical protein
VFLDANHEILVGHLETESPVGGPSLRSPRALFVGALDSTTWRLRVPLPVEIDDDGGTVTVHSLDCEVYGAGPDEYSALDDFRLSLVDEWEFLNANSGNLGAAAERQLRRMSQLIERQA